jgi:SAM-dependent methyltransferase
MPLHRPSSVSKPSLVAGPIPDAVQRLARGEALLLTESYGHGADIIDALRHTLRPTEGASFAERQAFQSDFRAASSRLAVGIVDHKVALPNPQPIGFLKELYPDNGTFFLPFVEVQHLYGAWQTYLDGVHLPVLGHKLRPFFGTYVPARTEHLQLFATWLSQHKGSRDHAIDVGTGSGVLARMMARSGYQTVHATDSNPNAIESVRRDLVRIPAPIEPIEADLLGTLPAADLIVFNPPWMPGTVDDLLASALYYDDVSLFERFFTQAHDRLRPDGRVVVLFSTIAELTHPTAPHPIATELERGRFHLAQRLQRKVKPTGNRRTKERVEVWELAKIVPGETAP